MGSDTYIEFIDGHLVTEKQIGEVQIKMSDNPGESFIPTLYHVILVPELFNRLFYIIVAIILRHNFLFH